MLKVLPSQRQVVLKVHKVGLLELLLKLPVQLDVLQLPQEEVDLHVLETVLPLWEVLHELGYPARKVTQNHPLVKMCPSLGSSSRLT